MANKIYNKQVPGFKSGGRVAKMGGGMMMKRPMMNKGGSLKPVDKSKNPGLAKLPTDVRNKMGFMKKGGRVGLDKGGSAKKLAKTVMSPITHMRNIMSSKKFKKGKK